MFSLSWIFGSYLVGFMIERVSWKWVAAILAFAALDVSHHIYAKVELAQAQGTAFAWPLYKIIGSWLALAAMAGVFFSLGLWKSSARRRRRKELGLQ